MKRKNRNSSAPPGVNRAMFDECIRCGEAPAVDELGYCGHCHWAVRAEIEEGFYQLREYLRSWARFSDWCEAKAPPPLRS
jgi:hypothetical protein